MRDSTFQRRDILGAAPKNHVSEKMYGTGYGLSTFIEPNPLINRNKQKPSDPLKIDDIDGTKPKANEFRTRRIVDPLAPKYQLASCSAFSVDPGRKFMRDTL